MKRNFLIKRIARNVQMEVTDLREYYDVDNCAQKVMESFSKKISPQLYGMLMQQLLGFHSDMQLEMAVNLMDFANEQNAQFILRGIRCVEDFEYERNMAEANKQLGGVETIILYTRPEYAHISSTLVRDLYAYGKDVSNYVPNTLR